MRTKGEVVQNIFSLTAKARLKATSRENKKTRPSATVTEIKLTKSLVMRASEVGEQFVLMTSVSQPKGWLLENDRRVRRMHISETGEHVRRCDAEKILRRILRSKIEAAIGILL